MQLKISGSKTVGKCGSNRSAGIKRILIWTSWTSIFVEGLYGYSEAISGSTQHPPRVMAQSRVIPSYHSAWFYHVLSIDKSCCHLSPSPCLGPAPARVGAFRPGLPVLKIGCLQDSSSTLPPSQCTPLL